MKWLMIPIWMYVCISLSSSAPIFVQNEMAVMYPMEYYPAYLKGDFNFDFTKWFRKAAGSVKHFYNFVNNLIFGEIAREPIFGRYLAFKETTDVTTESRSEITVHPQELEANVHGIQAFDIYKDEDGNLFLKNFNDPNGKLQLLQKILINSIAELKKWEGSSTNIQPEIKNSNPFKWNQNFDNDKLFAGAFQNYPVNSQLLWHSGIFSFQPLSAFNMMSGKVFNQNQTSQDQSSQSPGTSVSEISSQHIDLSKLSSTSTSATDQPDPEITTITEDERKYGETSENSNSLVDKLSSSSDKSSSYEVVMEVERLKQNNSNLDESNNFNQSISEPESIQGSNIFDETDNEDDTDNNDSDTDDGNDTEDNSNDFDYAFNDFTTDESNLKSQEPERETTKESTQELLSDGNTFEKDGSDLTIVETSSPSEATEKNDITEEIPVTENPEINLSKQNSDESDIAKKVLAIVQP